MTHAASPKARPPNATGDVIARHLDRYDLDAGISVSSSTRGDHLSFITVTRALVDAGASGTDWKSDPVGWTNRQIAILDPESKRKPVKGWRYRSDGRQIPWSAAIAFLTSAKRKKLRPKPGSRAEAEAIATLKRLVAGGGPVKPRHPVASCQHGVPIGMDCAECHELPPDVHGEAAAAA
jgi:hypothetical protein